MTHYERCFEAEVLHEVLYGIDAKCMKIGGAEADKLGKDATILANSLFRSDNLTEEGQKLVEEKVAKLQEQLDRLNKKHGR